MDIGRNGALCWVDKDRRIPGKHSLSCWNACIICTLSGMPPPGRPCCSSITSKPAMKENASSVGKEIGDPHFNTHARLCHNGRWIQCGYSPSSGWGYRSRLISLPLPAWSRRDSPCLPSRGPPGGPPFPIRPDPGGPLIRWKSPEISGAPGLTTLLYIARGSTWGGSFRPGPAIRLYSLTQGASSSSYTCVPQSAAMVFYRWWWAMSVRISNLGPSAHLL